MPMSSESSQVSFLGIASFVFRRHSFRTVRFTGEVAVPVGDADLDGLFAAGNALAAEAAVGLQVVGLFQFVLFLLCRLAACVEPFEDVDVTRAARADAAAGM